MKGLFAYPIVPEKEESFSRVQGGKELSPSSWADKKKEISIIHYNKLEIIKKS